MKSSDFALSNIGQMQERTIQYDELQTAEICLVNFLGYINPNKNGNNFKTIKIRMNTIIRLHYGGYSYSIRTSGEVLSVIIREITVLYVSIFFIGAKLQLFSKANSKIFCKSQFFNK